MKNKVVASFLLSLAFISCRSLKQPSEIEQPLDYSNYDVVSAEKDRIREFMKDEPVKALWRSILLNDVELKNECAELVHQKFTEALEAENYLDADRFYKSLSCYGWTFADAEKNKLQSLLQIEIPGLQTNNSRAPKSIADCMNATVTIWVDRGIKVQNGAGIPDIIIGSGFFIDERGYLITNHHVIDSMVDEKYEGFSRLYVKLLSDSDTKIPAKVVAYDKTLDLALLKVEIQPEVVLSLGSSSDLKIGDKVSVIGTPIGLEGTLTSGIISSTERKLTTMGNVFQLDAAVNSGNSGGPMLDQNMKVQGIVFAGMLQYQGLNFAIPVEYLKKLLPIMYKHNSEEDAGQIVHSWLSAYGHTMRFGNKKAGLEVQYVMPGGSASVSGLKAGDVITEIDGNKISNLDDFQFLELSRVPGTMSKVVYKTPDEDEKECFVYFEPRPESPLLEIYERDFIDTAFIPMFGMQITRSSSENKKEYKVLKVIKGSAADELSFSENDIVMVYDFKLDNERKTAMAQVYTQRKKKGLIDVGMVLGTSFDNPYYF